MKRRKWDYLFIIMLVLLIPSVVIALVGMMSTYVQAAQPNEVWVEKYFIPMQNRNELAVDLRVDSQGKVIVTGYKNEYPTTTITVKYAPDGSEIWNRWSSGEAVAMAIDINDNTFVISDWDRGAFNGHDYGIVRITPNNTFWSKSYNSSGNFDDVPKAVATDSSGSVIVTGMSWEDTAGGLKRVIATVKFPSYGEMQWENIFNNGLFRDDGVKGIAVDGDDNIIVLATTYEPLNAYTDFLTIKYAADGTELWVKNYDRFNNDVAGAVVTDAEGNIFVTGTTRPSSGPYNEQYTTIKYAPDGTELWVKNYDGQPDGNDIALALKLDPSGNVIVSGISQTAQGSNEYFVATVKYSSDGYELWADLITSKLLKQNGFGDLEVDKDGNILIVGTFDDGAWGNNYFTLKRAPDGTPLWGRTYGDTDIGNWYSDDGAKAVGTNEYGDVYVTGHSFSLGDPYLGKIYSQNYLTIKYSEYPTPVAHAGYYQSVPEGTLGVQLDGSRSSGAVNYFWTQVAGMTVTLIPDNTVVNPTFDAPFVDTNTTLTFELTVDNGAGVFDSASVNIKVYQLNNPPISDAGDDATVKEGAGGTLDGSNSYDPEGVTLGFHWLQVDGPLVELIPNNWVVNPGFTATEAGDQLTFRLQVDDGRYYSDPDTVVITVVGNSSPVANAGSDQTVTEGTLVNLDGSTCSDPDGSDTLSFDWTEPVPLSDNTSPTPSFTAPAVGPGGATLEFDLTVTDDDPVNPKSDTDQVVITVQNANDPPNCGLATASCPESTIKNNNECTLWPPNHRMVSVGISGVTDPDNNAVTIQITGVTQDEPVDGGGDGDTTPDAVISGDEVLLRAERTGLTGGLQENGRVYLVNFSVDDGQGGVCSGSVAVGVPHDRRDTPIDDGQNYDSTLP